jgi:hypothetical protein
MTSRDMGRIEDHSSLSFRKDVSDRNMQKDLVLFLTDVNGKSSSILDELNNDDSPTQSDVKLWRQAGMNCISIILTEKRCD